LLSSVPDDSTAAEQAREILAGAGVTGQAADGQVAALLNPWMRYFLVYDPLPELRELQVPVLSMWGAKDMQVPPEGNREPVDQALRDSGNPDVTSTVLPDLNHLLQTAENGSPAEYVTIEETMSPVALDAISEWIEARVR